MNETGCSVCYEQVNDSTISCFHTYIDCDDNKGCDYDCNDYNAFQILRRLDQLKTKAQIVMMTMLVLMTNL